jgi:hypothetical protein
MKRMFSSIILSCIVAGGLSLVALGQTQSDDTVIPEGTTAKVSLQTQLSSKINDVGDEVTGVLYEPVRSADGRVAIPRGTEFRGRVTQVQPAKKPQKQASITIVFDTMHMPYGSEKVSTMVMAIDDYANDEKLKSKNDEGKVEGGHSGGKTARNAGLGGALGSIGAIGGLGGWAIGSGVGAVGGVLMTKGKDIHLQPGTVLRIRFDREVKLPAFESEPKPTQN